ncbi:hypothetical protein D9M73_110440 [compost metagenome]
MRADLHRHAACHFGHRLEQRKRPIIGGDRLIGDARRARAHQAFGLRLVGGEMEIGEQQVARLQQRDFARLRFLDLHDHVRLREHAGGVGQDRCAGRDIVRIAEIDAETGTGLHDHLMARSGEFSDRGRGEPDAIFVILDFLGNADAH